MKLEEFEKIQWLAEQKKDAEELYAKIIDPDINPGERVSAISALQIRLANLNDPSTTSLYADALAKRKIVNRKDFQNKVELMVLEPINREQKPHWAREPLNLRDAIQKIRKIPHSVLMSFEKKQRIAKATLDYLLSKGALYITPEKRGYYFDRESQALISLEDDAFSRILSDCTGLNPTEAEFRYLLEEVVIEASQRGKGTNVYSLAHYDESENKLYVSDFCGGMFILDGESVIHARNGEAGILFITATLARGYKYLPEGERIKDADVLRFLAPINFDPESELVVEEAKMLLFVWLLSIFFPELHPTKIIPTFIGPQGSTKTTTARRFGILLMGERFNVGYLESADRGEQAFIATVCGKAFAAFDNADAPIKWLPDRLATFATGQEFELRELYTTNTLATYNPVAHIVLTSRDPHFRRPDVAERLLITKLTRPESFIPESKVLEKLLRERDCVWSDLLDKLNRAVNVLREVPKAPLTHFRMADFAAFGWRLSKGFGGDERASSFYELLGKLERAQAAYTTEQDPVATCLDLWLSDRTTIDRAIDTGALFSALGEIAKREGLLLPKTSAALGKRLHQAKKALELSLGVKISGKRSSHTSVWKFTKPREPENFSESPLPTLPPLWESPLPGGQGGQGGQKQEDLSNEKEETRPDSRQTE